MTHVGDLDQDSSSEGTDYGSILKGEPIAYDDRLAMWSLRSKEYSKIIVPSN